MDRTKQRVLDEIARAYPWLAAECRRQALQAGIGGDPGGFILPFGPFKGRRLKELGAEYLIQLLGQGSVRKSMRSCLERHLLARMAGQEAARADVLRVGNRASPEG
jgi:hypothetical protein